MSFRSCHRADGTPKVAYWRKDHAKRALRQFEREGWLRGELHAYRCPVCGFFHLGRVRDESTDGR